MLRFCFGRRCNTCRGTRCCSSFCTSQDS
ncbi:Protein CBG26858 [Caenorhabditis briggsae]|uniref:Protein CBG26858 n=1 Tax=Caenorhabditis briggsae TaxID=6238 RepID=B6II59_CAEBR|nr:Protein CBG26858 [Caenorhabditis briggsae]CAR99589.1 Protein CBG26858 [Caenorhabditis briggsae]